MPKNSKFDAEAAARLEKQSREVYLRMYEFDLSLSRFFTEKDKVRAPYIALLGLVQRHFNDMKVNFEPKIKKDN